MEAVSIRELRHRGGDVVDRVERGEQVVVTRDGRPVAELRPTPPAALTAAVLIARRSALPLVDPALLQRDIDDLIDASLP